MPKEGGSQIAVRNPHASISGHAAGMVAQALA